MVQILRILAQSGFVFTRNRSGATAIEYGLLAAGISVAIVSTVFLLGPELDAAFQEVYQEIVGTE